MNGRKAFIKAALLELDALSDSVIATIARIAGRALVKAIEADELERAELDELRDEVAILRRELARANGEA